MLLVNTQIHATRYKTVFFVSFFFNKMHRIVECPTQTRRNPPRTSIVFSKTERNWNPKVAWYIQQTCLDLVQISCALL